MMRVFVTGATGYLGRPLSAELLRRGHTVRALVRPGSESRLPAGCVAVPGDALNGASFRDEVAGSDVFVQLVGVAHPGPAKAAQFHSIDFVSVHASVEAAAAARVGHFVYVSVAHPAPVMKSYVAVRSQGERLIHEAGLHAAILRPWYVLGPGHRWPYALRPAYWLLERLPSTRGTARRLGLVTLAQMVQALVRAVEAPPAGVRVVEVPEIRCGA